MSNIKQLKENNKNIFPVTHEDAVLDNEGKSIGSKLKDHIENHPSGGEGLFDDSELKAKDIELDDKITVLSDEIKNDLLDGHRFKWLTQSEYDALSEEEKNDGITEYHITDAEIPSGNIHVVDNLISTSSTSALSANQGRILDDKIIPLKKDIDDVNATVNNHLENHTNGNTELVSPNGTKYELKVSDNGELTTSIIRVPVESISLDKATHVMRIDETIQLNAAILPSNASNKTVTWSSSDETKAIVANGLVTAKADGSCIITCTTVDGNKVASCNLTVVIDDNIYLYKGGDTYLDITGGFNVDNAEFKENTLVLKHSSKSILKTINEFTLNAGDKIISRIVGLGIHQSRVYELKCSVGSSLISKINLGEILDAIEGEYLFIATINDDIVGDIELSTYFGEYELSDIYIQKSDNEGEHIV